METTLIRGFVLFLALTGFGASSVSTRAGFHANDTTGNGGPTPLCPPSSGQVCGLQ